MKLDFGLVKNYDPKNEGKKYGFVGGFSRQDCHYWITQIIDKDKQNRLKARAGRQQLEDNVFLWYTFEETEKGFSVVDVYSDVKRIPEDILFSFLDNLHESRMTLLLVGAPDFCSQLFDDTRIPDDKLQKIVNYFFDNEPLLILPFLKETQKETLKPSLKIRLKNVNESLPDWMAVVSCELFGNEEYDNLYSERQEALENEEARRKQDFKTSILYKLWKNIALPLSEEIKGVTFELLGKEEYINLLLERQNSRFIAVDGLVCDVETGLMWLRFAFGQTWENGTAIGNAKKVKTENREIALQSLNKLDDGYAGFTDWRVPSYEESKTLVGNTNNDVFPNSFFVEGESSYVRFVRGQQKKHETSEVEKFLYKEIEKISEQKKRLMPLQLLLK